MTTGANGNGAYVRWSNGLQVCFGEVYIAASSGTYTIATWTFPAAFNSEPRTFATISGGGNLGKTVEVSLYSSPLTGVYVIGRGDAPFDAMYANVFAIGTYTP